MRHTFTIVVVSALIGAIVGAAIWSVLSSGDQMSQEELDAVVQAAVESAVEQAVDQAIQQSTDEMSLQLAETATGERRLVAEIFERISRSVVIIDAEGPERTNDEGVTIVPAALATGFVLDDTGHIVTAAHVLEGMNRFVVILPGDDRRPAERLGDDRPFSDVAVLRIELEDEEENPVRAELRPHGERRSR